MDVWGLEMALRRNERHDDEVTAGGDGAASLRLRESEAAEVVSRRGVLWRAGLATAAGAAALTALDQQRADAATGGNFVLGATNDANVTTKLVPTTNGQGPAPLMSLDGSAMSTTSTTLFVKAPTGSTIGIGNAVSVQATEDALGVVASSATNTAVSGSATSGTGVAGASTSGAGVTGSSTSGTGVAGSSSTGVGVVGSSTSSDAVHGTATANGRTGVLGNDTSATGGTGVAGLSTHGVAVRATSAGGTALYVSGKTRFSRSGSGVVGSGHSSKTVSVSGMTSASLVIVTLQTQASGVFLVSAVPGSGNFTVHLNKTAPTNVKFAWFAVAG